MLTQIRITPIECIQQKRTKKHYSAEKLAEKCLKRESREDRIHATYKTILRIHKPHYTLSNHMAINELFLWHDDIRKEQAAAQII